MQLLHARKIKCPYQCANTGRAGIAGATQKYIHIVAYIPAERKENDCKL